MRISKLKATSEILSFIDEGLEDLYSNFMYRKDTHKIEEHFKCALISFLKHLISKGLLQDTSMASALGRVMDGAVMQDYPLIDIKRDRLYSGFLIYIDDLPIDDYFKEFVTVPRSYYETRESLVFDDPTKEEIITKSPLDLLREEVLSFSLN